MIWLVILSMLVMAAYTAAVCIKQKEFLTLSVQPITNWSISIGSWRQCG